MHTLATAAKATGLNKSTVLRAIKSGKISAAKDEHGEWQIDPAELHRVYPPVADAPRRTSAEQRHAMPGQADATALLEAQIASLKAPNKMVGPNRIFSLPRWVGRKNARDRLAPLEGTPRFRVTSRST